MLDRPHVLVIGASGRFVAQSAVFAGYQVSVIDLFGDVDTKQICMASNRFSEEENSVSWAHKIDALSDLSASGHSGMGAVLRAVELEMGSVPFTIVFAGGAENYPEFFGHGFWGASLVAGPPASSVARLLHWPAIKEFCQQHQIQTPRSVHRLSQSADASLVWLQKRERSGGGLQVQRWESSGSVDFEGGYYLQQKIEGTTLSGCFVSVQNEGRGVTHLLGACQQLPNEDPNDFRYQGSLGPVDLDERDRAQMKRVGCCIASEFSLEGVWGIDFISTADGLFLVDINPRIPASAELIERYYRRSQPDFTILGAHLDAAVNGQLPAAIEEVGDCFFSKRIVYLESEMPLVVDDAMVAFFKSSPAITDIPMCGTEIMPGHPVVTIHAHLYPGRPVGTGPTLTNGL
jgi:predicted ATP-grasp superfamily ATP-dependent carboligase